jgi:hypothetical protein
MTARLNYPEAVRWNSTPWLIPAEIIKGPIISVTAGQNVAAFLNLSPAFARLDGNPLTNQFCEWALDQMPFLTTMTWPEADAPTAFQKLSSEAPPAFNVALKAFNGAELVWQTNQGRLVLQNLRVINPNIGAVRTAGGEDYLLLSLFPRVPMDRPPPIDLSKEIISQTNLVYYDWEVTGSRLQEWRMLGRMLLTPWHVASDEELEARQVEDKWFMDLRLLAGNARTRITRVSPTELSFERTAPLGFTGIEMFLLSDRISTLGVLPDSSLPPGH